jgi:hypothetical protein
MSGKSGMKSGRWDRHSSAAFWRGRVKASQTLKERGISPGIEAIAASMAVQTLLRMGTNREESPLLYEQYYELCLARLRAKRAEIAAA